MVAILETEQKQKKENDPTIISQARQKQKPAGLLYAR